MRVHEAGQGLPRQSRAERRGGEVGQSLFEFIPVFSFMLLYKTDRAMKLGRTVANSKVFTISSISVYIKVCCEF